MVHVPHVVVLASLVAISCGLLAAARAASPAVAPTILAVVPEEALEELASPRDYDELQADEDEVADEESSASGSASGVPTRGLGLFANNKIHIRDSRIVLTARDRTQLLTSIARAMVADQKKAMASTAATPLTSLVPLTRDAFLYLVPSTNSTADAPLVVRLGWRYPLAAWSTYKAFVTTQGCDVQRTIGDYFYC